MISDDPDEDADTFEEESDLENVVTDPAPKRRDRAEATATLPDWPGTTAQEVNVTLDPATLDWFRSTYVDWQQHISSVLRAWVAAHRVTPQAALSIEHAKTASTGHEL